jgi:hypothetical protein
MGELDLARLEAARRHAATRFRAHDWRIAELLEGRWDHHPDIAEYLAAQSTQPENPHG